MIDELPPLPEHVAHIHSDGDYCQDASYGDVVFWPVCLYTADQVRECQREAYEAGKRAALAAQAPQPQADALIKECRDALAEELAAWEIDPPLHHVKQAHDKCVAWLAAQPPAQPVSAEGLTRWALCPETDTPCSVCPTKRIPCEAAQPPAGVLQHLLVLEGCVSGENANPAGRAALDAVAAALAAQPPAQTVAAWVDPETGDVISNERKLGWMENFGISGAAKAANYTEPLVRPQPQGEDARDAERYRWLRDRLLAADFAYGDPPTCAVVFEWPESASIGADLDESIDAATKGER